MSRFGRVGRRPDHWASAHDRARVRAAERLEAAARSRARPPGCDAHLADCPSCASIAAAYEADRAMLRRLRDADPEPPRDLWARTAAAIEREAATRGRGRPVAGPDVRAVAAGARGALRARRRRGGPGRHRAVGRVPGRPRASRSRRATRETARPGACGPHRRRSRSAPARSAGSGVRDDGAFAYNVANIDAVCPLDRQPDCAPFADGHARRVTLTADPEVRLPVAGRRPGRGRRYGCRRCGRGDRGGPAGRRAAAGARAERVGRDGQSDRRRRRRPSSRRPRRPRRPPSVPPASLPAASEARRSRPASRVRPRPPVPEPSGRHGRRDHDQRHDRRPRRRLLARRSLVRVQRPAGRRLGRPGHLRLARRRSAGRGAHRGPRQRLRIVGRQPAAGQPGHDRLPRASQARPTPARRPSRRSSIEPTSTPTPLLTPSPAPGASDAVDGSPLPEPTPAPEFAAETFLIDPLTGAETPMLGADWQPVVDPTGAWVVAWEGTVRAAAEGLSMVPATGRLVIHPFRLCRSSRNARSIDRARCRARRASRPTSRPTSRRPGRRFAGPQRDGADRAAGRRRGPDRRVRCPLGRHRDLAGDLDRRSRSTHPSGGSACSTSIP